MSRPNQALLNEWNKKLADSGFEDIEQDEDHLKQWSSSFFLRIGPKDTPLALRQLYYESKQDYFILAEHFLNIHKFKSASEKKMWKMHAEGKSMAEIAKTFNKPKSTVGRTILKIAKEMLKHDKQE